MLYQEKQHELGRNLKIAVQKLISEKDPALFMSALADINNAVSQKNYLSFWLVFGTILPQLWRVQECCLSEDSQLASQIRIRRIGVAIESTYNYVININQFDPNWISNDHATDASQTHAMTLFNANEYSKSEINNMKTNQHLLKELSEPSKSDHVRGIHSCLEKYAWSRQGKQLQALVVEALPLTERPSNRC